MPARKNTVRQNQDALSRLKEIGAQVTPGAVPGAFTARLHGRWATVTIAGLTLNVFEYSLEYQMETFDATVHGETWKTFVAGDQSWTGRVRGYFNPSATAYIATLPSGTLSADAAAVTFKAFKTMQTTGGTARIWSGSALATRIGFDVPYNGMIIQELALQGTGLPTFGVGSAP